MEGQIRMEFVSRTAQSKEHLDLIEQLTAEGGGPFDVGFLFVSSEHQEHVAAIVHSVGEKIRIENFLTCTCAGIIGSEHEIEKKPAASLFLANLPDVRCKAFHLNQSELEKLRSAEEYYRKFEVSPKDNPVFLLIPDPFQIDLNTFMEGMNEAYGSAPLVGGLASASASANGNVLIVNGQSHSQGMIGLVMNGNIKIDVIVSQGCKPVGETYIVTRAEKNIIHEVAGRSFLEILRQVFSNLDESERQLMQQALLVGIAMDEYQHEFSRGDFLVRPVIGIDQATGAVGIGDRIQTGQTIQLHLRDAKTASEDLKELLQDFKLQHPADVRGAFVFSCNGRGQGLFGEPDHDIKLIQQYLGPIPAAGFFCAGEIGPIGGKNFIHGFTDSIVVFS